MVKGSCIWQNVTTCLCHMLAITLPYPTGPKEESEMGGPRTKAVLEELQMWGKADKADMGKEMSDTQTK